MPLLCPNNKIIFFVHVPKTGGSSVEDYLARRFGPLSMVDHHKRERVPGTGLISPITHLSALDLEEIIPAEADLVFTMVRDPLQRMLSEYRWQAGASRMGRLDFSTWLRIAISAARRERRIYENHIRPQDEMVPPQAEVFRLEDGFDPMISRIDEVVGSTASDIRVGHLKNRKSRAPEITVLRQDAELIGDFFAADYDRFGYERPDPAEFESDFGAWRRQLVAAPLARALVSKQRSSWVI